MWFIKNLSIRAKLSLINIGFCIALAITTTLFWVSEQTAISFASKERIGIEYLLVLKPTWVSIAKHRGTMHAALNGESSAADRLPAIRTTINQSIEAMEAIDRKLGESLITGTLVKDFKMAWATLATEADSGVLSAIESFSRHTELVAMAQNIGTHVGDTSNLLLDPDLDSYYLMSALVNNLPYVLESLGSLRGQASGAVASGSIDLGMRKELTTLFVESRLAVDNAVSDIDSAIAYNDNLKSTLQPLATALATSSNDFLNNIESKVLESEKPLIDANNLFALGTTAIDNGSKLFAATAPELDDLLAIRINGFKSDLYRGMGLIVALTILALFLSVLVIRNITRSTQHASDVLGKLSQGDFNNTIHIDSKDELGKMLTSLLTMQTNLNENINAEREAARTNARLKQALDNASASMMIFNREHRLFYINEAGKNLLQKVDKTSSPASKGLSSMDLIDSPIESFHGSSDKPIKEMINSLTETNTLDLNLSDCTFRNTYTPIFDTDNQRIGTIVEWQDRTSELSAEVEVQAVVEAAKAGDLSKRINLASKQGFFAVLGDALNELVDVSDSVVGDVSQLFDAWSQGDLTKTIDAEYAGEFERLKTDANKTVEKLSDVVVQIKSGAAEISRGTKEISDGNSNLSKRTEEQAASLEETASSMEEITSIVSNNAKRAAQASQLSEDMQETAHRGGDVVRRANNAMKEINNSSQKIADIIGVIDELSFQTNLLALNAAVEAARAGDQGRGFAVVASEVRNLAQRSATSAKEIKELIEDSVKKVTSGAQLVEESGETLDQIVDSVVKVSDIVKDIADSSQEQSAGISLINTAIAQMDSATQRNSALVEQVTVASESMADRASGMYDTVAFFSTESAVAANQWDKLPDTPLALVKS